MREIKNYIHTLDESRQANLELMRVQKETSRLFDEYIIFEKPLRGDPNYMELRKVKLAEYRAKDKEVWGNFVKKYRELGWDIGTE